MPRSVVRSIFDRHPRALATAVLFALLALVGVATAPAQASPENPAADEAQFVAKLNETRAKGGLAPLTVDPELRDLARGWAQQMADAGHISHANPISEGVTADWRKLGENVGTGGNVTVVMNAFIASPGHYANIMDPEFTKVGVGVVWVGNALYTTHRFMKLAGQPAPEPPSDPTPAPEPGATTPPPAPAPTSAPVAVAPKRVAPTTSTTTAPPPTTTTAPPPPPPASPTRVASVLGALIAAAH